jgi:hypothetical protein
MSVSTTIGAWRAPPIMGPMFCSPFDEALAAVGPPAVFLHDGDGLLRFDSEWTRDAWQRVDPDDRDRGPTEHEARWVLLSDRVTGFSFVVLATSPQLLRHHPRLHSSAYTTRLDAFAALHALGVPPLRRDP